jgi:hypothetical protein
MTFSPNQWVQATPDYAVSLLLSQRPGAPDPGRSVEEAV